MSRRRRVQFPEGAFANAFGAGADAMLESLGAQELSERRVAGRLSDTTDEIEGIPTNPTNAQLRQIGQARLVVAGSLLHGPQRPSTSVGVNNAEMVVLAPTIVDPVPTTNVAGIQATTGGGAINTPHQEQDEVVQQAYAMLQSRNKRSGQKLSSTEKKINPTRKTLWPECCRANGILSVAEQETHLQFLKEDKTYDLLKMRGFAQFCDSYQPALTYCQFDNALIFMQYHLNLECTSNDMPKPQGAVKGDPVIKVLHDNRRRSKAVEAISNDEDMQTGVGLRISDEEMVDMALEGFHPTCDETRKMDTLSRIQTIASMLHTHQTGQRGDDIRSLSTGMAFTRTSKFVGPGRGTAIDLIITKQGKTNKASKHEYSGFLPHVNPIRDAVAWMGICALHRHLVLLEHQPQLLDYKKFMHLPLYRSVTSANKFINSDTQGRQFKSFYQSQGVVVGKVVHQGRVQVQQDMDDNGISTAHIARACKYSDGSKSTNRVQAQSYLDNPPITCLVDRAGGDPHHPKHFNPAWDKVKVSEALLNVALPGLTTQVAIVNELHQTITSKEERKEKRLDMTKGSIDAFVRRISRGLLLPATRPLDSDNKLQSDSEPYYMKFQGSFELFRSPVFQSPEFLSLVAEMRTVQDNIDANKILVPDECRNEIERQNNTTVMPALKANNDTSQLILQKMEDSEVLEKKRARREELHQLQNMAVLRALWNRQSDCVSEAESNSQFLKIIGDATATFESGYIYGGSAVVPSVSAGPTLPFAASLQSNRGSEAPSLGYRAYGVTPRKRKAAVYRHTEYGSGPGQKQALMSSENTTLPDFWGEFAH